MWWKSNYTRQLEQRLEEAEKTIWQQVDRIVDLEKEKAELERAVSGLKAEREHWRKESMRPQQLAEERGAEIDRLMAKVSGLETRLDLLNLDRAKWQAELPSGAEVALMKELKGVPVEHPILQAWRAVMAAVFAVYRDTSMDPTEADGVRLHAADGANAIDTLRDHFMNLHLAAQRPQPAKVPRPRTRQLVVAPR